jgi:AcrR family transcriptional regulator
MENIQNKSTREIRSARTRQSILDSGLALLKTEGFENISLRAIARKINYSAAALYEYFNNKEDLLAAMTEIISNQLTREMKVRLDGISDPEEQLLQAGLAVINFALNHPNYYALFSSQPFSPGLYSSENGCDGSSFNIITDIIHKGLKEGFIQNPNQLSVEEFGLILWGVVHGLASLQNTALKNAQIDQEKINREALMILIRGLV